MLELAAMPTGNAMPNKFPLHFSFRERVKLIV
jgi:hypothetical protein